MWLAQTYYFVNHSARLIALTASRFPDQQIEFSEIFLKYIDEEVHHEKLALMDIKNLGGDIKMLPCLSATSAVVQSQYYWIEHVSPFAFYGYILALEGFAVKFGQKIYSELDKKYGHRADSFLRVHVKEDVDHLEHAFVALEKVPSEFLPKIQSNFTQSIDLYVSMLDEISKHCQLKNSNAA